MGMGVSEVKDEQRKLDRRKYVNKVDNPKRRKFILRYLVSRYEGIGTKKPLGPLEFPKFRVNN